LERGIRPHILQISTENKPQNLKYKAKSCKNKKKERYENGGGYQKHKRHGNIKWQLLLEQQTMDVNNEVIWGLGTLSSNSFLNFKIGCNSRS
jgi:hypothetical protein